MDYIPPPAVTGAAMDTVVPKRRGRLLARIGIAVAVTAALAWGGWQFVPHGLQVAARDVRLARVEQGVFRDDIVVRATAEPLNSIILDSVESGRGEEVFARDGQAVKKGDLLFRLSNPQRNLELLARQTEYSQQIFNAANLRAAQEAVRTDHQRRLPVRIPFLCHQLRHMLVQRLTADIQKLQIRTTCIRGAAQNNDALVFPFHIRLHGIKAHVRVDGDGIRAVTLIGFTCILLCRRTDITALGIQNHRNPTGASLD